MDQQVKIAFKLEGVYLPLSSIHPSKQIEDTTRNSTMYKKIMASIKARSGIVEPLVVCPLQNCPAGKEEYLLLNGNVRFDILSQLGYTQAKCIISTDDENYTYNQKVNQMNPIQEHFMIMRAIAKGVSEKELMEGLNFSTKQFRTRKDAIKGICPEVVSLLGKKQISYMSLSWLRKVKSIRQVDITNMMIAYNDFSAAFVRAAVLNTVEDQLVTPLRKKDRRGLKPEDIEKLQRESRLAQEQTTASTKEYSENVAKLIMARNYINQLFDNPKVVRFLSANYSDTLKDLHQILGMASLEG